MKKLKRAKGEDLITADHIKYKRHSFALNDMVDAINVLQEKVKVLK